MCALGGKSSAGAHDQQGVTKNRTFLFQEMQRMQHEATKDRGNYNDKVFLNSSVKQMESRSRYAVDLAGFAEGHCPNSVG